MANLGRKFSCFSCHTKFYDLGKAVAICPKCGADQAEGEDFVAAPVSRSRRVVEEPIEEPEFESEEEIGSVDEEDETLLDTAAEPEEEEDADEDEDEEY